MYLRYIAFICEYNIYIFDIWIICVLCCAKSLQSCPTLCDPMYHSPPGSSIHGIYQARILEWVTMPSSRGSPPSRDRTHISWFCALAGGFFTTSATWEAYIYISWNSVMFKFVDLKHKTVWFSRRNVRVVKVLYLLQMPCNTPWPPPWDASLSPSRCYFLTFCYLKDWIKHLGTVFSW